MVKLVLESHTLSLDMGLTRVSSLFVLTSYLRESMPTLKRTWLSRWQSELSRSTKRSSKTYSLTVPKRERKSSKFAKRIRGFWSPTQRPSLSVTTSKFKTWWTGVTKTVQLVRQLWMRPLPVLIPWLQSTLLKSRTPAVQRQLLRPRLT